MPAISVIVPVHNGSKYLGECLKSILSQDFREFEVICVDDASSDESPNILKEWAKRDSRIFVLKNAKQQGAGRSRNTGMDAASGQYVLFVDSDDLLTPEALGALIQRAREDCVSLVRGNLREFSSNSDVAAGESPPVPNRSRIDFSELPQLWIPWGHTAWLIERAFLEDSRVRYTSLTLGEDPLFLAQLLTSSDKISTVEHLCYLYRVGHKVDVVTESDLADYVTHAKEVKSLFFGAGLERCWVEGYSSVALNGLLYYHERYSVMAAQHWMN
jgi:glycosyltransferase involved in cell wall biosynthesis